MSSAISAPSRAATGVLHTAEAPRPAVLDSVGGTPLVPLRRVGQRTGLHVLAKLEGAHAGGSTKDRVASTLLGAALHRGRLRPGDLVVESSSGNMAISLAQASAALGLQFVAVIDPGANPQTVRLLQILGAEVDVVHDTDEDGNHLSGRLARVRHWVQEHGAFWPNQYADPAVAAAHARTMEEIVTQLGSAPDAVFAAVSTGGTLAGFAQQLRRGGATTRIVAVDAEGSRIFGGPGGPRRLPGHGSSRTSDLLDPEHVDTVVRVSDIAAVRAARSLLAEEGLLVGASSGAVTAALERLAPELPQGASVALLFCDRGERYLDTVYNDTWVRETLGEELDA